MGNRTTVFSVNDETLRQPRPYARVRRRSSLRERVVTPEIHIEGHTTGFESVEHVLRDILRSAAEVLGATQGFLIVARGETVLEVAATHCIRPAEVMDAVLAEAALPIRAALRERILAAGDISGSTLPLQDGSFENNSPAVLCIPLELGPRQSGVLCMLRRQQPRRLSDLDLEIVQALAEQAALAIGAASHSSALSRLHASLTTLEPAYA